jgi:glucans biosynthesis protein C
MQQSPNRLYFLDWLRIYALILLIVFHVGMYYVSWDYHVKSPYATDSLAMWMMLSEPWRLSLLFLISGIATGFMIHQVETKQFAFKRSVQLLLPLICGIYLVVPPQTYYEAIQKYGFQGNFFDFLKLYYAHARVFCHEDQCLVMPTWNHLWFLPYIWVYTMVIWFLKLNTATSLSMMSQWINRALSGVSLVVTPIALLWIIRLTLFNNYPTTHDFTHDIFNHARYFLIFALGYALSQNADAWPVFSKHRLKTLILAIASWALYILTYQQVPQPVEFLFLSSLQWSAVSAAMGYGFFYLNFDSRARNQLTQAVFPIYLFHQTVLIVMSQWLAPLSLNPWIESSVLIALTLTVSYLGYALVRPIPWIRTCFGLGKPTGA